MQVNEQTILILNTEIEKKLNLLKNYNINYDLKDKMYTFNVAIIDFKNLKENIHYELKKLFPNNINDINYFMLNLKEPDFNFNFYDFSSSIGDTAQKIINKINNFELAFIKTIKKDFYNFITPEKTKKIKSFSIISMLSVINGV